MSFECLLRIFSGAVPTDAKRERDGFKTQDISPLIRFSRLSSSPALSAAVVEIVDQGRLWLDANRP